VWPHVRVELRLQAGLLVARIEGEVDLANAARVERVVMDAVARERPRAVVADLEPLRYLDGAGRAWLRRLGERLAFCGLGFEVRRPAGGPAARMFELLWPMAGDGSDVQSTPEA
jgi:anti-anti-sigma factor